MRKSFLIIAMFLASVCGTQVYGQSLKNLFSKDNLKKAADAVVEQLDVTPKNVAGQWEYDGIAVSLGGDNKLANAASNMALGSVEEKLNEYLAKVGIKKGTFSYTFNDDEMAIPAIIYALLMNIVLLIYIATFLFLPNYKIKFKKLC